MGFRTAFGKACAVLFDFPILGVPPLSPEKWDPPLTKMEKVGV